MFLYPQAVNLRNIHCRFLSALAVVGLQASLRKQFRARSFARDFERQAGVLVASAMPVFGCGSCGTLKGQNGRAPLASLTLTEPSARVLYGASTKDRMYSERPRPPFPTETSRTRP